MTDPQPPIPDDSPYQSPESEPARFAHCPDCRAEVTTDAQTCWMCGRVLDAVDAEVVEPATPHSADSFSLSTLMILVTLVAVGLGLFVTAPGLGILYTVAMVPALVRTAVGVRSAAAGKVMRREDKLQLFATSIAVTVAAGVAATVAFFATCVSTCFVYMAFENNLRGSGEESFVFFSFAIAGLLALAAFGGVFYLFRTRRKNK